MPPAPAQIQDAEAEPTAQQRLQMQRACVAVALAPVFVLLGFTLVVTQVIDVGTGLALFAACTAWVVFEMLVCPRR